MGLVSRRANSAAVEKLRAIIDGLDRAERMGAEEDVPEGVRYFMVSDTLGRQMSADLGKVLARLRLLEELDRVVRWDHMLSSANLRIWLGRVFQWPTFYDWMSKIVEWADKAERDYD